MIEIAVEDIMSVILVVLVLIVLVLIAMGRKMGLWWL
jgi:hypothetical protein